MIKLTTQFDTPLWVSPEHIVAVKVDENGAYIELSIDKYADGRHVSESPEEVARKVLEYQFKMKRVKALAQRWANEEDDVLKVDYQLEWWENAVKELSGLSAEKGADHDQQTNG